ncbi:MAG: transcriptional repressor [Gammaproteobacteria bacterium]|nr:transcriptional repressor [Gammaproteobacteria bacterium]
MTQPREVNRSVLAPRPARDRSWTDGEDLLLTPVRQQVLDLLRATCEPIGAYALRDRLEEALARRVSPPTVYRALNYLQRRGLAARVESCSGWIACELPDPRHAALYCVCRACGSVVQARGVDAHAALLSLADRRGFVAGAFTLEVSGLCAHCRTEGD